MIIATAYKMLKSFSIFTQQDLLALLVGLIVSFFVAWAVIAAFLRSSNNIPYPALPIIVLRLALWC